MEKHELKLKVQEFAMDPSKQREFFQIVRFVGISVAAGAAIWSALTGVLVSDVDAVCCYDICYGDRCCGW
ncbi:MAG: hypothetical protein ACPLSA_07040 [Caldanaerobacter sp.]